MLNNQLFKIKIMKSTKFLAVAFAAFFMGATAIKAQTEEKVEVPNWCKNKAIEYVNKLKLDVTITPADSAILVEEFALRVTKGNNAWKAATTPEDKKAAQENAYKEYSERIKSRLQKDVYSKILKWQIQQNNK